RKFRRFTTRMKDELGSFDWLIPAAADRERLYGEDVRWARALALRGTGLLCLGALAASYVVPRGTALVLLVLSLWPAALPAPGLRAGTLAAARAQRPRTLEMFVGHLHRTPEYVAYAVLRRCAVLASAVVAAPAALLLDLRMLLAAFLLVDRGYGPVR